MIFKKEKKKEKLNFFKKDDYTLHILKQTKNKDNIT